VVRAVVRAVVVAVVRAVAGAVRQVQHSTKRGSGSNYGGDDGDWQRLQLQ
jgi:hypothetical protein